MEKIMKKLLALTALLVFVPFCYYAGISLNDLTQKQGDKKMAYSSNPAQNFVTQMMPYSQGNTSSAAQFVSNMLPYSDGGPMEPGSVNNPNPGPTAEQQAQAAARNGVFDEKQGYMDSVGGSISQFGQRYGNSITDYLDSIKAGQSNIDTAGAKNELARNQGQAGVLGMVGRGINSAGVMLGNRNAGDSSAAGAIANAYGKLGQQQMSNVGNQYELGNMDIQNQQTQFDTQKSKGKRDIELGKSEFVTGLLNDTQDKLSQLNARLVDASLPDRIAIEQEKEAIRQRATSSLQQYDQNLSSGYGGVNASSTEARRAEAQRLQNMGTNLGADAFNFTDQAPLEFQGASPAGSNLPIFTLPRRRVA